MENFKNRIITFDPNKSYLEQYLINKENCKDCIFFLFCGGECKIERNLHGGNNIYMCKFKRTLIMFAMYISLELEKYVLIYDEIKCFCKEKEKRFSKDLELENFLIKNSQYSFVDGKKVFDKLNKKY